MKKLLPLALVTTITLSSLIPSTTNESFVANFQKIDQEIRENSKAYETLKHATETIGHRLTGSPNGAKAEQLTYDLFKSYGFKDVQFQPFEVEAWARESVTLAIAPANSDNYRDVPVVALAHSPLTSSLQGEIIDVGNGLEEDFEAVKEKVKGKVVLSNLGLVKAPNKTNLHRSEKTALAIKYGAKGIIFINYAPAEILLTGTASVTGDLINIPAMCISSNSGKELRSWLMSEAPLIAEVEMKNTSSKINARNVIATLKGKSKETIIVGGHLDSWDLATGAIDNGIGSFSVLDIARTYINLGIKPEKTIQFVMFMGEEQGLLGSRHFIKEAIRSKEIKRIAYMMNIDMTNNPQGVIAYGRKEMEGFFKSVGEEVKKVDASYKNDFIPAAGLHSDHQPFMLEGIPTMAFHGILPKDAGQCYHADCDQFSLVNKEELEKTIRVASMYLYAMANTKTMPTKRLSSEQTRDLMIQEGLKEKLILGNDWKW